MQFTRPFKIAIAAGRVTRTFRYWRRPQAKPGGRYRIAPFGGIEVDDVRRVAEGSIDDADARAAGFADREALMQALATRRRADADLYRIEFRFVGALDDPRAALRRELLDEDAFAALTDKLRRMDARGSWTRTVLELIRDRPATRAAELARRLGWDTARFKVQVRKLKAQGLTESLEAGYRLSPRGADYLRRLDAG